MYIVHHFEMIHLSTKKKRKILKISKMGNIKGLFLITNFFFN